MRLGHRPRPRRTPEPGNLQLLSAAGKDDSAVLEALREACAGKPELAAAYAYRSAFAGSTRAELTIGLAVDDGADAARVANTLVRRAESALEGDELLFQVLGDDGVADIASVVPAFYVRG